MILAGWIVFLGLLGVLVWLAVRRRQPGDVTRGPRDLARAHIADALLAQYVAEHPRRAVLEREIQHLGVQAQLQVAGETAKQYTDEIEAFLRLVRIDNGRTDLSPRPLDALFQPICAVLSSQQRAAVADELQERGGENGDSGWLDRFAEMARSAKLSKAWEPYDPDAGVRESARLKARCEFMEAAILRMVQIHPHPRAFTEALRWTADKAVEDGGTIARDAVATELEKWMGSIEAAAKDRGYASP